ncbi:hypothetical protein ABZ478_12005 [Streptomyces sp. NPDC005706]|uniref:hypothetical protein n=1 Tax=Streptomyces sp. NPDC005706 TaxID=3157169 RepID=UPI0033DC50AC
MADSQSNARLRADAGAPTSGVIHVRTRLTADITVLSNALAQRRGSAVTIGVAAYILSLPDGSPVSIAALCEHFTEGEILISRALRELEAAGYLERRRERLSSGQIRTRTYLYDVPGGAPGPDGPPEPPAGPPRPPKPRRQPIRPRPAQSRAESTAASAERPSQASPASPAGTETEAQAPAPALRADTEAEAQAPAPLADADPRAVAVLAALRRVDPRLVLSGREAARLAPAVADWLAAGLDSAQITGLLTAGLPGSLRARPAHILAFRLRETPLPAPPEPPHPVVRPPAQPLQNCDGCDRAFRAPVPGHCRDCRPGGLLSRAC